MAVVGVLCSPRLIHAQPAVAPAKTILAIGAHAGDMELTAGAVLLKQRKLAAPSRENSSGRTCLSVRFKLAHAFSASP